MPQHPVQMIISAQNQHRDGYCGEGIEAGVENSSRFQQHFRRQKIAETQRYSRLCRNEKQMPFFIFYRVNQKIDGTEALTLSPVKFKTEGNTVVFAIDVSIIDEIVIGPKGQVEKDFFN